MDAGRRWAIETFGMYGPTVRARIASMVKEEHEALVDAQEASGHRSTGVYGQFWRGILEKFETLGALPGADLVRPGLAPYKIPVVNGVAIYPWRFGKSRESELAATPFATSDARHAVVTMRPRAVQETLNLGLSETGLTDEEELLLLDLQSVTNNGAVASGRCVLVAIASSVRSLHSVNWGEMRIGSAGYVELTGYTESLLSVPQTRPASLSPTGTFQAGEVPAKFVPKVSKVKVNRPTDE